MQNDFVASLEALNKNAIEAARKLSAIQLRAVERLTEQSVAATTAYLEGGVRQVETLREVADVQAAATAQARFLEEMNQQLVEHAKQTADILNATKAELGGWVDDNVKAASASPFSRRGPNAG